MYRHVACKLVHQNWFPPAVVTFNDHQLRIHTPMSTIPVCILCTSVGNVTLGTGEHAGD